MMLMLCLLMLLSLRLLMLLILLRSLTTNRSQASPGNNHPIRLVVLTQLRALWLLLLRLL
jgi:hypothetical protein